MANDIYIITPTDGNSTREINISPYSTNGTNSPVSTVLNLNAVSFDSSLLFYGKGSDQYGERFQENFYHLLENFSGYKEPVKPQSGQLWFDNNDNTLKIFEVKSLEIFDIVNNDLIVKLPGNPNSKYFQLIKDSIKQRFPVGFKFDIFSPSINDLTLDLVGTYTISATPIDTPNTYTVLPGENLSNFITIGLISVTDIPTPGPTLLPPTVPYIGMWIPLNDINSDILDTLPNGIYNNIFARVQDLNVADNKIINLADPIDVLDAANKQYVDGAVTGLGSSLNFVTPTDLTTTLSSYVVTSTLNNYILKSGDTMTGQLVLNSDPVLNLEAATKQYVDTLISGVSGGAGSLNTLLDTNIITPAHNDILIYNFATSKWDNSQISLNGFNDTDFIKKQSDTMLGQLKLIGQAGQNGVPGTVTTDDAITAGYMDNSIINYVSSQFPTGDIRLSSGTYDSLNDILVLTLTDGNTINIPGIVSNINANSILYSIISSNVDVGDYLTSTFLLDVNYPNISIKSIIDSISKTLKYLIQPNKSNIQISDNRITPYNAPSYVVGYNTLQIFVNGLKNIPDTVGYQEIVKSVVPDIYPNIQTNLPLSTFSFNISVDGGANQLISLTGANIQTYGELINEINLLLLGFGNQASCNMRDGKITVRSHTPGNTSSILISDITLFAALSNITINPPIQGITYDYSELGSYGTLSSSIQFNNVAIGNNIEMISLSTQNEPTTNY